ncbi:hypothetical protein Syun_001482 [Stephania yunnanensis]|uniref:Uncharacterized protein n=1 Tax=Stephania yunnanensis TaxID=152371 RepID=A0AAP0Q6B6_9MAGN
MGASVAKVDGVRGPVEGEWVLGGGDCIGGRRRKMSVNLGFFRIGSTPSALPLVWVIFGLACRGSSPMILNPMFATNVRLAGGVDGFLSIFFREYRFTCFAG